MDYRQVSEDAVDEIMISIRKRFSMKPQVAIAGFGKSGKSSLFNAIYGAQVAAVSMRTDETEAPQTRERFGIDFTDTPGIGTGKFSLDKVVQMGVLDRQHVVIHIINGASAISADDEALHEILGQSQARRVTVVNKVDILDEQERGEFAESMRDKLGLHPEDFMFISAKHGAGVPRLVAHIADVLPEAMQDAFIAVQQADAGLKRKRIRALIYSKAVVSAGVGAIPVPIADIFVLTPLQLSMVATIGYFHGVAVSKERTLELLSTVGAGVGLREAARQLVKLIPGYGSAISAAIAFAGTVALGEVANVWFERRMRVDADELKTVFTDVATRAKLEYADYRAQAEGAQEELRALRVRFDRQELTAEEFAAELAKLERDG